MRKRDDRGRCPGRPLHQIRVRADSWITTPVPSLQIIDPDLAARVDARRGRVGTEACHRQDDRTTGATRTRQVSVVWWSADLPDVRWALRGTAVPQGASTRCLHVLDGTQEARYVRQHPALFHCRCRCRRIDQIAGEALDAATIERLLALVDRGETDDSSRLTAERTRLQGEIDNLVASIAAGVPPQSVAPGIAERQATVTALDRELRRPRQAAPNIERLREALTQRAAEWRQELRSEPAVARQVFRRSGRTTDADGSHGSRGVYRVGGVAHACVVGGIGANGKPHL